MDIVLNVIFEHICEFKQNRYVRRCTFDVLVFSTGLKWGVTPGGGYGGQGGSIVLCGLVGS